MTIHEYKCLEVLDNDMIIIGFKRIHTVNSSL